MAARIAKSMGLSGNVIITSGEVAVSDADKLQQSTIDRLNRLTQPVTPLPSRPVVTVPILELPAGLVPVDFTAPMREHLDRMVAMIPPDKRGQARLIIDLTGVEADIATRVNEHVEVAAAAGKQWSGGVYAGAQVRIVW